MKIDQLKDHLNKYKDGIVLIGPGAVKSIHSSDPEQDRLVLTNKVLRREPDKFWDYFSKNVYVDLNNTSLTESLKAIEMLYTLGYVSKVVTLTTDGMLATKSNIAVEDTIPLHGTCQVVTCTGCKTIYPTAAFINAEGKMEEHKCELCGKSLKPNMLMFGETYNDQAYQDLIAALNNTHTVFTIGLDYTETPIVELIASYCDLKSAQADQGQEKIIISVVEKDLDMDLNNQIGFHEFLVKDECDNAMERFLQAVK